MTESRKINDFQPTSCRMSETVREQRDRANVTMFVLVPVADWHSARGAWNGYQPGLGSIPRPGRINCLRITGVHALRLISRKGKRVWRCPL